MGLLARFGLKSIELWDVDLERVRFLVHPRLGILRVISGKGNYPGSYGLASL